MTINARRTRQLYVWHKWTGLLSGLFIFVLSLSGAVAVFKHEIDWLLTPAKRVAPTEGRASLDHVLRSVREQYPRAKIAGIQLPHEPHTALSVRLEQDKTPIEVFADPYTGRVKGARTGETVANVIRQLHVRFYYFGAWGRVVVGCFGLVLLISTVTGLLIYGRFMKAVFAQGLRFWQVRRGRGWQVSASDWHKLIGVLALIFNLIIALTGAVLGLENLARYAPPVSRALHPSPKQETLKRPPASTEKMLSIEEACWRARAALPGFEPTNLLLPVAGKNHFMVYGNVAGRFERAGASFVVIETGSGAILDTHDAAAARAVTKAYNLSEPLHFGDFAGLPFKLIYCLCGFASAFLSITGYVIYVLKARSRRRAGARATPAPQAEQTHDKSLQPQLQ